MCTVFSWNKVRFLHSSQYWTMFWILKQGWQHRDVLVTQSRRLRCFFPHSIPARMLGMYKELGGDIVRTGDANWPKGYPTVESCSVYKSWGRRRKRGISGVVVLSAQRSVRHDGVLLSCGWLNTCLSLGSRNQFLVYLCSQKSLLL